MDADETIQPERETMHKPNNLLESDVQDEFDWDPLFDNSRIIVKANDGNVTLTGAVDSYYDTVLASDDAWSVSGVKSVDNELLVGLAGEDIADADIAADCLDALDRERFVPKGQVNVIVVDGWVTLSGEVRRHFQRQAAHHAVSRVDGVLGITNNITLSSDAMPDDIADRISTAFQRHAILDDSTITVSVSGNTVYLDGTVGSWKGMDEAVDTTWAAPGVTDVVNRLIIAP
jgi:osmotically-inducible protein OsmY